MPKNNTPDQYLNFIKVQLQKRGLSVTETTDGFDFSNRYLSGSLKLLKPIVLTWKEKPGFEIADNPSGAGKSSVSFKKISDALNFISRRLSP